MGIIGKRGVELSMNVIIIAILVILVLVILAVFFTGGITNLFSRIKTLYGGQLIDVNAKIASCNAICNTYATTQSETFKKQYCEDTTPVDLDGDGAIKGKESTVTCQDTALNMQCTAITC